MTITAVLSLLGGIGMFLYGMNLLGTALEQLAGAGLEKTLEKLTTNKISGLTLGTVTTGVIQSSAATCIMVMGFVNAGIMKLVQGVPVIMGANIGSTVTGQILRLGDISADNIVLTLLKPSSFAPLVIAIGSAILLFSKKKKKKNIAKVLIGFGILFMGMTVMESTISPLKDNEEFRSLFLKFQNPLLGILLGIVVTSIIQSSSASVGILQAISSTGAVTFSMAAPIIIGQNIGKCTTVLLGCIGTNKQAKRAALIQLLFNLIGAALFVTVIYSYQYLIGFSFWDKIMNRGNIADFHTFFNLATALILLPFTNLLIKLSELIIKNRNTTTINQELDILDDIFLKTPALAIAQSKKVLLSMAETVQENYDLSVSLLTNFNEKKLSRLNENEHFLDKAETVLGEYLVKITSCSLTEEDTRMITEIMHQISDYERIGDYCINIMSVAEYNSSNGVHFSERGKKELKCISNAVKTIIHLTVQANKESNKSLASRVEPLEEVIDSLKDNLESRHIERLKRYQCNVNSGISFVEVINNMERISDHCSNIAVQIVKRLSGETTFDTHEHLRMLHDGITEEYKEWFQYYESVYYEMLEEALK